MAKRKTKRIYEYKIPVRCCSYMKHEDCNLCVHSEWHLPINHLGNVCHKSWGVCPNPKIKKPVKCFVEGR